MKAYVLIKIRPGGINEAVKNLRRLADVKEAHATLGPYDALATVQVDSVAKLGRLVNVEIQAIPGIENTLTCLAIEE